MEKLNITQILKKFIAGILDIDALSELIDDRLFELRQEPELTNEQERLSNIELLTHEVKEGYRSRDELYEYIFSIIEQYISEQDPTTFTLNTYSGSESTTSTRTTIPVVDYLRELSFV